MSPVFQAAEEYSDLALKVDQVLEGLQGELDASMNPHQVALQGLGWTHSLGYTPTPYNDAAFELMSELISRNGGDLEALHRLALMHHARAIDLETGEDPSQSDPDWQAAERYWYELWKSDAFWDRIAELACKNASRAAVDLLRERFPELFLHVRYDVAFHEATKTGRARRHIDSVIGSPFPEDSKSSVRRDVYEKHIGELPHSVWREDMLEPGIIEDAMQVIQQFLNLDPGCVPALADALRLQVRLLLTHYHELQALSEDNEAERTRLLNTLRESAEHWMEYFEQLVDVSDALEEDVRHKLCHWYRVMGEVLCALDREEEAIAFYEWGVKAGCEEDDEKQRCVNAVGRTYAFVARERVHNGQAGAAEDLWTGKSAGRPLRERAFPPGQRLHAAERLRCGGGDLSKGPGDRAGYDRRGCDREQRAGPPPSA